MTDDPKGAHMSQPEQAHAPARALPRRYILALGGVAVVLLLGAVVGYAALSDPGERSEDGVMGLGVEVNAPTPPAPVPQATTQLEVLSPDMIQQPLPMQPPPLTPEEAYTAAEPVELPPDATHQASFNCATARPGAEQMVCADASLAAADREMAQAYRRALRAGASAEDLRLEQRDWIALREDAARRSPQALAAIYFQRIDDLNAIADR